MHQANKRINEYCAKALGIPDEQGPPQHPQVRQHHGRHDPAAVGRVLRGTGASSPGDLVLMVAFGAGMTWGASLVRA